KERLANLGGGTRGTMAWDCLFGRDHCCRLRDFCAVRFSADPTFRSGRACRHNHRYFGKPIRVAAAWWSPVENERNPTSRTRGGLIAASSSEQFCVMRAMVL